MHCNSKSLYFAFSFQTIFKVAQKNPPQSAEALNKSSTNTPQPRPRKRKVQKTICFLSFVINHYDSLLMVNTTYLTFPINTSCFLICCIALALISLRPSPWHPLMPVASLLSHMMWFDKGNLLQETTRRLFAGRANMGYGMLFRLCCGIITDELKTRATRAAFGHEFDYNRGLDISCFCTCCRNWALG